MIKFFVGDKDVGRYSNLKLSVGVDASKSYNSPGVIYAHDDVKIFDIRQLAGSELDYR